LLTPDRQYVSQYAQDILIFSVHVAGVLADADGQQVSATLINNNTQITVFTRDADRTDIGIYQVQLTSDESKEPDDYRLIWNYVLDQRSVTYVAELVIGKSSPAYDNLPLGLKSLVDQVYVRFEDLFDSPWGGPNLQTYFQTRFHRGRMAQMMQLGLGRLNTVSQPYQTYTLDTFPLDSWGALLERATAVEVIKHLRRSYVEQPDFQGGQVTRLDRRDYLQRWGEILEDEEDDLKRQLETFKIAAMGMGKPAVLTSGGVYGRWAPTRYAGSAAARGRFYSRFY
jgi:hypothetical protein